MEFRCDISGSRAAHPRIDDARMEFQMIRQLGEHALTDLPTHGALVERLCARDAARILTPERQGWP